MLSSHPKADDTTVQVTINQTATRILVCLEGDHSISAPVMAVLNCRPGVYQGLTYLYENTLAGEYFNDWHRATAGKMKLRREGGE